MSTWTTVQNRWQALISWVRNMGITVPAWMQGGAGSQWPPADDLPRIYRYDRHWKLYNNQHEAVFVDEDEYIYDEDRPYIACNLCSEITDLISSRLFGEPPEIAGPEDAQDWLQHLQDVSNMETMLLQFANGVSYRGDGVLKIRHDAEKEAVVIQPISPSIYFPTTDDDDASQITSATLGWIIFDEDNNPYLFQEIHSPGMIERKLYVLKGVYPYTYEPASDEIELSALPETADLDEQTETGVDEMLLVHVAIRTDDEPGIWGTSDYAGIEGMQGELNNRYTQRAEILDRHADPWMIGPPIADDDGQVGNKSRYVEVEGPDAATLSYVTWDGQLAAAQQEIAELKSDIFRNAGLSPESSGDDEGGGNVSGRALKLRQWRTASTVHNRQRLFGTGIQNAVSVASKLAAATDAEYLSFEGAVVELEPQDVTLGWQDGLPDDRMQKIEEESMLMSARLSSKRSSIKRLNPGMSEEQIDEEIEQMQAEENARRESLGQMAAQSRIDFDRGGIDPDA